MNRIIDSKMMLLGWKVDGFVGGDGFIGRKILLSAGERTLQCSFDAAIDPYLQVEMLDEYSFKDEDAFEEDDIDVIESISVRAKVSRGLVGEVHVEVDFAVLFQREDKPIEHFVQPE